MKTDDPQIKLPVRLKDNSKGGEVLSFIIPLGYFQLVCIVNIPGEGESESVAYVKFKVNDPKKRFEEIGSFQNEE